MKIAFVDLETTGLDFVNDEIIEIAIVVVDSITEKVKEYYQFFLEAKRIDEEAAKINGYYVGKWGLKADNPCKVAEKVNRILKDVDEIFAHNAAFDRSFMSVFLAKNGIGVRNQCKYFLDTATIAFLFKKAGIFQKINLNHCLDKLNLLSMRSEKHGALEDAMLLKDVYFKLIKLIEVKWNN